MRESASRQLILDRINAVADNRRAEDTDLDYLQEEIYKAVLPDALTCFKQELEAVGGQCVLCDGENDMYSKLAALVQHKGLPFLFSRDTEIAVNLKKHNIPVESDEILFELISAGITGCESLIARTGSVLVSSAGSSGRQMYAFPPIHIVLATEAQLVNYPEDALENLKSKYDNNLPSEISIITGPSRTADIEKTLVLGAHGPKELIIFVQQRIETSNTIA